MIAQIKKYMNGELNQQATEKMKQEIISNPNLRDLVADCLIAIATAELIIEDNFKAQLNLKKSNQ